MKHKILIVMENVEELGYILDNLKDSFQIATLNKAKGVLEYVKKHSPNLILIDSILPDKSGIELCRELKDDQYNMSAPLIMVSTDRSKESEAKALECGVIDYIQKPLNFRILKSRMDNAINSNLNQKYLKELIQIRTHELEKIQNNMIHTISIISEYRDPETAAHILRTKNYVLAISQKLRENPKYSTMLTPNMIKTIYEVAPLHDIGKIIIPDSVLLKPGTFSEEEYTVMKKHTNYGAYIIELIEKGTEENFYLEIAHNLVHYHHEKWDGTGYPEGLKGSRIPLSARIMAVADTFDALINKRSYREAFSFDEALKKLDEEKGRALDPDVVDAFLSVEEIIRKIVQKYSDAVEEKVLNIQS